MEENTIGDCRHPRVILKNFVSVDECKVEWFCELNGYDLWKSRCIMFVYTNEWIAGTGVHPQELLYGGVQTQCVLNHSLSSHRHSLSPLDSAVCSNQRYFPHFFPFLSFFNFFFKIFHFSSVNYVICRAAQREIGGVLWVWVWTLHWIHRFDQVSFLTLLFCLWVSNRFFFLFDSCITFKHLKLLPLRLMSIYRQLIWLLLFF